MDVHRAYKILGLSPGASKEEVHGAFRDLVQVWHPDRFAHDDRLRQKAQRNVKRINAAFQVLKDYEPPPGGVGRPSLISATFSAIQDLGEMMQTTTLEQPQARASEDPLLAAAAKHAAAGHEESARFGRRRRMQKESQWVSVALLISAVVVLVITILLFW